MSRRALVAALALACTAAPSLVYAQRGVDVETFHPALDGYGIFTVERSTVAAPWQPGVRLFANVAGDPLRLTMSDPTDPTHAAALRTTIVDRLVAVDLGFYLGLTRWLELVVDVPVAAPSYTAAYGSYGSASDPHLVRSGFYLADRYTNVPPPNAAPLDSRVGFKARLGGVGGVGFAVVAVATLPFGDDSAFLGDTGFTFRPLFVADLTRGPLAVALNVGAVLRQETRVYDPYDVAAGVRAPRLLLDVGDELTWSAGSSYRVAPWVAVAAEVYGLVPLVGAGHDFTAEAIAGLQLFATSHVLIALGAGAGFLASADRRDLYRAFVGVSWSPSAAATHGAAFGPDRDHDGIPDAQDVCPNEPEDRDGFDDEDGCPDLDNDGDGIPDVQDKCPNEPEDRDGFDDDDGCPDEDNDGDGIPDARDKCPNEPETRNGVDDDDGCPDVAGSVAVTDDRVLLPEPIRFDTRSARVAPRSEALLKRVADTINARRAIKRIRIEGHSDDSGSARANRELSQARADAVRAFLISRGVAPERLQAVGFGDTRPLDPRHTAEARAKNRRVDLIIVEQ